MKFKITPLLLLAAIAAAGPAGAQAPPANPRVSPFYQIAAGDVLSVSVVNFPNLSTPQMVVAPDGTISLPLLHQVSVAGLSTAQATELLRKKWRRYVINPAVTVSLTQKHPQTVIFSGCINTAGSTNHSGAIDYRPGLHLLEALAQAGGALPTADPANSVVTHSDGSKQSLDLSHPEKRPGTEVDIALQPGDVVYVPEQLGKVSVVGEVKRPGNVTYKENLTVLDALEASGGVNMDSADLTASKLIHKGIDNKLDLEALLRRGDMAANVNVAPGDRIIIPEIKNRTYVFGDVLHPGYYYYKTGDRLTDALSGVGGPTALADLGKVNVIHTDKVKEVAQMDRVSLNEFLLKGDLKGNPLIKPGDHLYIPDKKRAIDGGTILQTLGAAIGIGNLVRFR